MNTDPRPPLVGFLGTVGTFSLAQVNDALGLIAGILSIAYLIRQHIAFRREKRK